MHPSSLISFVVFSALLSVSLAACIAWRHATPWRSARTQQLPNIRRNR